MAPRAGVEPATFRLGGGRSIRLSYRGNGVRSVQGLSRGFNPGSARALLDAPLGCAEGPATRRQAGGVRPSPSGNSKRNRTLSTGRTRMTCFLD